MRYLLYHLKTRVAPIMSGHEPAYRARGFEFMRLMQQFRNA